MDNNTFPPFLVTPEIDAEANKRIKQYPDEKKRSAVLPLLHIIQHNFGFINTEATEWVASKLALEPMQVHEVVSFYPGLREHAPGKYHMRICRTLSCAILLSPHVDNGQWSSPNASHLVALDLFA
jgi:NADH-quinone oxidoreductase subunit E